MIIGKSLFKNIKILKNKAIKHVSSFFEYVNERFS